MTNVLTHESLAATVIVPTRNRADMLQRLLPALAQQLVDQPYEVIIADNGSTDATKSVVADAARRWSHIKYIVEDKPGGTRARHAGALAAQSPLLIFVDDDMRAEPKLVAEHLQAQASAPGVVVGNVISVPGSHPFDRMMAYIYDGPKRALATRPPTTRDYWSGNVSINRELYFRLGGYSDALAELRCGEDMEFGLRLAAAGVSVKFAPHALTYHHLDTERFAARLSRCYRIGVAWAYLRQRHGDLQAEIAPPARGRWRARFVERACRIFARLLEPFDRRHGVPSVPLAYVYALGIKTATGRGIADYYAGRTQLINQLEKAAMDQAPAPVVARTVVADGQ